VPNLFFTDRHKLEKQDSLKGLDLKDVAPLATVTMTSCPPG
jgi:hypothetical protein